MNINDPYLLLCWVISLFIIHPGMQFSIPLLFYSLSSSAPPLPRTSLYLFRREQDSHVCQKSMAYQVSCFCGIPCDDLDLRGILNPSCLSLTGFMEIGPVLSCLSLHMFPSVSGRILSDDN